jgi:hypothetical protein
MLCFARNSFLVTVLWAGALSWCGIQLPELHSSGRCLRTALQECFLEFLIYRLSSRHLLAMNQPVNIEERNRHVLEIGLRLLSFLRSRWCRVPLRGHLLCLRVIPINPAFVTSDYRGREFGIVLGSITEVSKNWHAIVLLLLRQKTGRKFCCHKSYLQIFS